MRQVMREDILPNAAYLEQRDAIRTKTVAIKAPRRIHVGKYLTFLFETTETMRYQVQEMLRVEGTTSPEDIDHEIHTYNELLGADGELGCTLLIEIEDVLQRDIVLRKWTNLPQHLYLKLADGSQARAIYDERQVGDERLSSVQYLKFSCGTQAPVAIGLDMPDMEIESDLTSDQRAALAADLGIND